jgi:mono/diheme cytochrome c family protein
LSDITRLRRGALALLLSLVLSLVLFLGVISVLIGDAAHAQNLDEGKSAPRLFADGCAACHRSARGLTKGRFSLTLYLFLQNHYASNSSSAWALTSYLESLDDAPRGRSRAAAAKPSPNVAGASRSSPRPPVPVPVPQR